MRLKRVSAGGLCPTALLRGGFKGPFGGPFLESLDLRDVTGAGGQHDQAVETEGDAGGGRDLRQGCEQGLVDRIDRLGAGGPRPGLLLEPAALLDRVGQLTE